MLSLDGTLLQHLPQELRCDRAGSPTFSCGRGLLRWSFSQSCGAWIPSVDVGCRTLRMSSLRLCSRRAGPSCRAAERCRLGRQKFPAVNRCDGLCQQLECVRCSMLFTVLVFCHFVASWRHFVASWRQLAVAACGVQLRHVPCRTISSFVVTSCHAVASPRSSEVGVWISEAGRDCGPRGLIAGGSGLEERRHRQTGRGWNDLRRIWWRFLPEDSWCFGTVDTSAGISFFGSGH